MDIGQRDTDSSTPDVSTTDDTDFTDLLSMRLTSDM
jgi:hypothetical protein